MRQFIYGMAFGAIAVYFYASYGDSLRGFQRYTLQWRDWAVNQSDHYSAGHETKK